MIRYYYLSVFYKITVTVFDTEYHGWAERLGHRLVLRSGKQTRRTTVNRPPIVVNIAVDIVVDIAVNIAADIAVDIAVDIEVDIVVDIVLPLRHNGSFYFLQAENSPPLIALWLFYATIN